jgi:hypothetical protein
MSGAIYIVENDTKRLIKMQQTEYVREEDFQQLLQDFPDLLAGEQMDSAKPRKWILVKREAGIPSEMEGTNRWSLDHLFLDQDAIPTLVEVKRKNDTRLRREVVGQMLDYAANATKYWSGDEMHRQFIGTCLETNCAPDSKLSELLGEDADFESFWEKAYSNLLEGRVRLVFVADIIPQELQRIVEFLNERMQPTEVLAVEIRQYTGEGYSTHIPRLIGQTAAAQLRKNPRAQTSERPRGEWDKDKFLAEARERGLTEDQIQAMSKIFVFVEQHPQIEVEYGKGASYASLLPKLPQISKKSPFVVWAYGFLEIKLPWLNDNPKALEFRQAFKSELERVGIETSEDKISSYSVEVWSTWVDQLISATRNAMCVVQA